MRHSLAVGCLFLAWAVIPPNAANATCGEECDQQYSSDVDDCHSNFGDDPADADDLATCIREARDDYRSCLDDCASAAISRPRWSRLAEGRFTMRVRSLCRGPKLKRAPTWSPFHASVVQVRRPPSSTEQVQSKPTISSPPIPVPLW
jgi:hypothetical protein